MMCGLHVVDGSKNVFHGYFFALGNRIFVNKSLMFTVVFRAKTGAMGKIQDVVGLILFWQKWCLKMLVLLKTMLLRFRRITQNSKLLN